MRTSFFEYRTPSTQNKNQIAIKFRKTIKPNRTDSYMLLKQLETQNSIFEDRSDDH